MGKRGEGKEEVGVAVPVEELINIASKSRMKSRRLGVGRHRSSGIHRRSLGRIGCCWGCDTADMVVEWYVVVVVVVVCVVVFVF